MNDTLQHKKLGRPPISVKDEALPSPPYIQPDRANPYFCRGCGKGTGTQVKRTFSAEDAGGARWICACLSCGATNAIYPAPTPGGLQLVRLISPMHLPAEVTKTRLADKS